MDFSNQPKFFMFFSCRTEWAYRFTQTVNGKRHNHKSVKDENGEPMKSQKAAIRARQLAIMAAEARKNRTHAAEDNIRRSLSRVL